MVASRKEITFWDIKREEKKVLALEGCEPNLVEMLDHRHVLVGDKWMRLHDF